MFEIGGKLPYHPREFPGSAPRRAAGRLLSVVRSTAEPRLIHAVMQALTGSLNPSQQVSS